MREIQEFQEIPHRGVQEEIKDSEEIKELMDKEDLVGIKT